MSERPDSYWAGIIDGEGTIVIARNRQKNGKLKHKLRVTVGMTHEETIKSLHLAFGGNISLRHRQKEHWKDVWVYETCSQGALNLIRHVSPWLITKAPQALLATEFYEKTFVVKEARFGPVSSDLLKMREEYAARMAALNLRGFNGYAKTVPVSCM